MPWPPGYAREHGWLNPWPIKYLMPAVKWFPLYWPNQEWELIGPPPETWPREAPKPPDGAIIPWWKMPKSEWPIEAPWEEKVFGAWPASQITMAEDLSIPSVWPGPKRAPPFGFIKIQMPGPARINGVWNNPKGHQIPFSHMRIHMRPDLGPIHHMKMLTQVNAFGETQFFMIDKNWNRYDYDAKEYRKMMKQRKEERFLMMIAEEIARTNGKPKPPTDLFE
jgi:hypothetical protein